MPLVGVHICIGGYSNGSPGSRADAVLPANAVSSETIAAPGTSAISAAATPEQSLLSANASLAIFYATGPAPNASVSPRRYYDPTNNPREDVFINAGDKFAWIAA